MEFVSPVPADVAQTYVSAKKKQRMASLVLLMV